MVQVVPDVVRGDDMDIRRYVWITNVPGGRQVDSHLVSGVVFRKNISHKRMSSVYNQPKILMMSCAIEYQVRSFIISKRMSSVYNQPKILMMSCAIEYQVRSFELSIYDRDLLTCLSTLSSNIQRIQRLLAKLYVSLSMFMIQLHRKL